jgi:glycosyltransferase involved in cell wall biosynthesis
MQVDFLYRSGRGSRHQHKWEFSDMASPNLRQWKGALGAFGLASKPSNIYVCLDTIDPIATILFFYFRLRRTRITTVVAENRVLFATGWLLSILSRMHKVLAFHSIRSSDVIIADSDASKRFLISIGCDIDKIRVLPHGVDRRVFNVEGSVQGKRPLKVLYAGGLYVHKGYRILAEAIRNWNLEDFQFKVVRFGPESDAPFEGLTNVEFLPQMTFEEMSELYKTVDIVVVPSISTETGAERSPNVVIEAIASGCVVVASNIGGIPTYLDQAGILVPENDSEALANALSALLSDSVRQELREKGLTLANNVYDMSKYAKKLLRAITSV